MKPFIYIASPYSHENPGVREARYKEVSKYTANLICCGNIAFSPIAHSHSMALSLGDMAMGFSFWQELDEFMLMKADVMHVLCLPNWENSDGVAKEIVKANELGIPVVFIPPEK